MEQVKKRTKILFWAQLPPPLHGASLRNKAIFESNLIRDEFDLVYVPFNYSNSIQELGGFSFKKFLLFIKLLFKLFWKAFRKDFDVVYFTYSLRKNGILRDTLFVALFRMFNIPIIFHFRNQGAKDLSKSKLLNRLMRFSFKKGHFICLSKSAVVDVEDFINLNNLYIVNNGIEPFAETLQKTKDEVGIVTLFYLSNLRHEKGIYTLLEVFETLQTSLQNELELNIVGEEGDVSYAELETYIELHKLKNVNVLGPKYGTEKLSLFAQSDLFLFPSRNEVFPGVILEAMQLGLPIVTTNVGAIPDIIETNYNGIVCEKDDHGALVHAVTKLIENPALSEQLGAQAKIDFFEKYTLDIFEENMLQTWQNIIKKQ